MPRSSISKEQWKKIGDAELSRDAVSELISDTEALISASGYTLPATVDVKTAAEESYQEFLDEYLSKIPEGMLELVQSGGWRENLGNYSYEYLLPLIDQQSRLASDPQTLLFYAYRSFKAANENRATGDMVAALHQVASGASDLARSISALHAAKRSEGGKKKIATNSTAMHKSQAIQESKTLWDEREAGKHPKLRTEDQFAIEVARRWPIVASISAIKKRSAEWRAANKAIFQKKRAY